MLEKVESLREERRMRREEERELRK